MKHSLLTHTRWLAVLAVLLSFSVGASADNVNDLKVLGQTPTAVTGTDYYTFQTSQGQARWYPSRRILELENAFLSNDDNNESFVEYTGTNPLYIFLIGTNTFSNNKSGQQAKPAIKAGGSLTIQSKDFDHRGTLRIWTYGYAQSYGQAAVLLTGYSTSRNKFNIERCNIETYIRGGGSQVPSHYFFRAYGGNYKGELYIEDAKVALQSRGLPILGNATISLSKKDCVRTKDVSIENGQLVNADGSTVTYAAIDYPIAFNGHDDARSSSYLVSREDFDTDGGVIFDEDENVLEFHGGSYTGSITYYGREPLTVKTFGTELTTLTGDNEYGIRSEYTSMHFEGDRVNGHQGLRLTYGYSYNATEAIHMAPNTELTFDNNAVLTIDGYDYGLVGCNKAEGNESDIHTFPYIPDCPTFSATKSTLHINAQRVAIYGFYNYLLSECRVLQSHQVGSVWMKNTDEYPIYEYYYYQNTFYDIENGSRIALNQIDIVRSSAFSIKVGGRSVTTDNMYDLTFNDEDGEVRGVSFDDETYTLTLDNAYIHAKKHGVSGIDLINPKKPVTIFIKGDCNILSDEYIGIYTHDLDITVKGENQFDSKLTVHAKSNAVMVEDCMTMSFQDCLVDLNSEDQAAFCGRHDPDNNIYNNFAKMQVYSSASVRLHSDEDYATEYLSDVLLAQSVSILSPEGAAFNASLHGIAKNGQRVKDVLIGANIYFADQKVERVCADNWDTNHDGGMNIFEIKSITSLGTAFYGNADVRYFDELKYFTGLTAIDEKAFDLCTSLEQLTLPPTVTRLNMNAFTSTAIQRIVIPKSVKSIETSAFQGCRSLTDVVFEEGSQLQSLGWGAFYECEALERIELPVGITTIPAYCFYGCTSLYSYVCEGPLKTISDYAFSDCQVLYMDVPDGVEYVGDYAFSGCYCESFSIPASLKYVGVSALTGAMDLYIPEDSKLEEVADYGFSGCDYGLLTLPASLRKIGDYAFGRSGSGFFYSPDDPVTIVVNRNEPAEAGESIFGELPDESEIRVPDGRANRYKAAWPEYEPYIVGGEIPTTIDAVQTGKVKGDVYTVRGELVRRNATTEGLPAGIYIVGGRKVVVK